MNFKVVKNGIHSRIMKTDEPEGVDIFSTMNAARIHLVQYLKDERDSLDDLHTKYSLLIKAVKSMRVYDL